MLTLKKFLKYFDVLEDVKICEWETEDKGAILFEGSIFSKKAKKKLKKLFKAGYVLDRNEDGTAVLLYPRINSYGVAWCDVQINVKKRQD